MIEEEVKTAIAANQSGSIALKSLNGRNESSLSWEHLKKALKELSAPQGLKIDIDKGELTPFFVEDWIWLEQVNMNPNFRLRVNTQDAHLARSVFRGVFSDGSSPVRDADAIAKAQKQTEMDREFSGYGKSRMGCWVE